MFGSVVIIAVAWIAIGYGLRSKKQAGSVLLSLGRSTRHKMFLFFAGLWILLLVSPLWDLVEAGTELDGVFDFLGMLSFGVFILFLGWSGPQILEAGIFSDGQLLKWERIESYELGERTLIVRISRWKRRWSVGPKVLIYRVRPLQKDAVNDLLAQHVSGATVEPGNGTR